jgi:PPOX class probable F420-dependent enzyme
MVFESGSEADARALERLRTETIGWLTTVTADGQPQTFPIWFLWEDGPAPGDGEILIYSDRRARRNLNLQTNPRVSLHLDDDGDGSDVVIIEGIARVDETVPGVPGNPAYLAKYGGRIRESLGSPEEMATVYNVPLRIRPTRGVAF